MLYIIYSRDYADAIYGCSLSFIAAVYGICLLNLLESNEDKKLLGASIIRWNC